MFKRAVHPGVILKEELEELGITPTEFARQIEVVPNCVQRSSKASVPSQETQPSILVELASAI